MREKKPTARTRGASVGGEGATAVLARVAILGAVGAALAVVESLLPRPIPWVRLGIGHAAVLLAMWTDGPWAASGVMFLKIVLAGLVGGMLAHPLTLVAAAASVAAMGAMSLVFWAGRDGLAGPVGAGIAGSAAYGVVQIWLVGVWLVKAPIWPVAPLILGPGVLAGGITGLVALAALWRIRRGAEEWYRALA